MYGSTSLRQKYGIYKWVALVWVEFKTTFGDGVIAVQVSRVYLCFVIQLHLKIPAHQVQDKRDNFTNYFVLYFQQKTLQGKILSQGKYFPNKESASYKKWNESNFHSFCVQPFISLLCPPSFNTNTSSFDQNTLANICTSSLQLFLHYLVRPNPQLLPRIPSSNES